MSLIFASGGGRLGNQLVNIINLIALSIEYDLSIYKIEDNYLKIKKQKNKFLPLYNVNSLDTWEIDNTKYKYDLIRKFKNIYYRTMVRILHIIFYILPSTLSLKYGNKNARVKYLLANKIDLKNDQNKLLKLSKNNLIIFSGWGLRDWELVKKHKNKIINILKNNFSYTFRKDKIVEGLGPYLFVHIRNGDFANSKYYEKLVYTPQVWANAIIAVCRKENLSQVILFTDNYPITILRKELEKLSINIITPEDNKINNFIGLFINYASNSSSIICNSSTLTLCLACLYHKYVYNPDIDNIYQSTNVNDLHIKSPHKLNWK